MASTKHYSVQIKRGTKSELESVPPLLDGELAWITDEKELYVGTKEGINQKVTHATELGNYTGDTTLSDLINSWSEDLQEFKDIIKHHVLVHYDAVPLYIEDASSPDTVRGGVIYVNNETKNLPEGFVTSIR